MSELRSAVGVLGSGGFTLELLDGRPVFRRPDGSMLEGRAPP